MAASSRFDEVRRVTGVVEVVVVVADGLGIGEVYRGW